jgi:hypothetical protein
LGLKLVSYLSIKRQQTNGRNLVKHALFVNKKKGGSINVESAKQGKRAAAAAAAADNEENERFGGERIQRR